MKWVVAEENSDRAAALAGLDDSELVAPDSLIIEAANALATKVRRGEVVLEQLHENLQIILAYIEIIRSSPLIEDAANLAISYGRSVYDCLYLALAVREGCQLVTADERFYNALNPAFAPQLLWIGDVPDAS
jgi:predicted nucleic acid-binding protein